MPELEIKNFKSIKYFKQDCQRVNIFIGEPNSGKSNILEAFGLFSFAQFSNYGSELRQFVRHLRPTNLFYDDFIESPISFQIGNLSLNLSFQRGGFAGEASNTLNNSKTSVSLIHGDFNNLSIAGTGPAINNTPLVKYYKFEVLNNFPRPESEFLLPPVGRNLLSLLLTNHEIRSISNSIFSRFGLKLVLKPHENAIEIIKQVEDILISYPYPLVSDTLQRLIFYLSAILSSKDSILVFEEPEAHTFPYYTKYLAEIIALDESNNQYFIATHNPYFLEPLIEKTAQGDLNIFITYFEDYQTKVRLLSQSELQDLMKLDIFSNFDRYVKTS